MSRTRGRAHFLLNQFDKATEDFDAALRIDAKDPTLLAWIADLKRRTAAAPIPALQSPPAPTVTTDKPAEQADVLATCSTGNDYHQRVTACSAQIASGSLKGDRLASAYYSRGWAQYELKQLQAATQDLNQAISLSPSEPIYFNDRGVFLIDQNDLEGALRDFNQAIAIKPDYALAHANRGLIYRDFKRPDEALTELSTAIRLNPKLVFAYQQRSAIYEEKSDWRAMYDDANKLIELTPNDRLGYDMRGEAYFVAGQYEPAISDFTKSISLNPNSIYAYRTRGRAHFLLNQFDKATQDFDAALRIDSKDSILLSWVADLKRRQGRP
jgi:tetratricopeptide (TPR) repeat protein